ncbi:MAG: hypothetical protein JXR90_05205 [Spirochaetes bacterium]|nr:hypothetical protein [Spirochaetota bacterium]
MVTKNDEITTEITQREVWKQPEITELDINKTESGNLQLVEIVNATGSLDS